MADDIDTAQEIEQRQRDAAIKQARSLIDIEREHMKKLEEKGISMHCLYCGEELFNGYTRRYCEPSDGYSCAVEHQREIDANKRNNGVR